MQRPLVLIILDGWGLAPPGPGNAISQITNSQIRQYWHNYPHSQLSASGEAVGLPIDEDGNTETGHINLGAGRVVYQDLPRINHAVSDGSFFKNEAFIGAVRYAHQHKSNLHLLGLLSDSGVHASRDHLYALLALIKEQKCNCPVFLHLFTDGRDSPPRAGLRFLSEVTQKCQQIGIGKIATVIGRYYAMDRDRRWERTEKAYVALTEMINLTAKNPEEVAVQSYKKGVSDEFIEPTIITDENNQPLPRIQNHDVVIFYNYRVDRPRQLTRAFVLPDFETHKATDVFDPYSVKYYHKHIIEIDSRAKPFKRKIILPNLFFVTMTEYERNLPCVTAFPPEPVTRPLGRVIADLGWKQLRISETEKERFVTYYFNGMREDPYPGEDRLIIPSPKVATYDLKPEMSIYELTEKLIDRSQLKYYGFILVNYANPDMVGHTGNIPAAVKACTVVDACVKQVVEKVLALEGSCVITGDHGNVEEMLGPNGEMDTEHSTFPVPMIVIDRQFEHNPCSLPNGKLGDVAPTMLALRNIAIPEVMTGKNLLTDLLMQRRSL